MRNNMENYTEFNAKTIDGWNEEGWEWGTVITHDTYVKAKKGDWSIVLTPQTPVPKDFFAPFLDDSGHFYPGTKILGLASAGGQQMPVLTAAGADCTVLDLSDSQLEREKRVAQRENYEISVIKADMTQPLPFEDESFDVIVYPVSNCYIENVQPVWQEAYRVLKKGGILLSGLDNGFNYLFNSYKEKMTVENILPYNPLKNPAQMALAIKENDGVQFSHTFGEQIGGQLQAGFVLTAAFEDFFDADSKKFHGFPEFWATKAVK